MAAKHRPPCIAGEHCGEAAHCPPVERKPRSRRRPAVVTIAESADPRALALAIAAQIAEGRRI